MFKVKPQDWLILKNEKKKPSIDWAAEVYCEGGERIVSLWLSLSFDVSLLYM